MNRITAKHLSIVSGTLLTVLAVGWWLLEFAGEPSDAAPPAGVPAERPAASSERPSPVASPAAAHATKPRIVRKRADTPAPKEAGATSGPTATLTVRVVAAGAHDAVAGAWVEVTDADCTEWAADCGHAGDARFEGLPAGATEIRAGATDRVEATRTLVLDARANEKAELALDWAAAVEGLVVDADGAAPVAGATVSVTLRTAAGDRPLPDATTDETGRFRVPGVQPPAELRVRVQQDGFSDAESVVAVTRAAAIPAEIRLARSGSLRGVVVAPHGKPAGVASVRVTPAAVADDKAQRRYTACGRDGGFAVEDLVAGTPYVVVAEAVGWAESEPATVTVVAGAARDPLTLRLRERATIVLRVVTPEGNPARRAIASFDGSDGFASADEHGVIRREQLTPGRHSVAVMDDAHPAVARDVDVAEGAVAEVDIAFERGVAIQGVVVDARGEPIAGVYVYSSPPPAAGETTDGWDGVGVTDATGAFAITGLPAGDHDLFVVGKSMSGFVRRSPGPARARVTAPCADARVVAGDGVSVSLRVVLPADAERPEDVLVSQIFRDHPSVNDPGTEGVPVRTDRAAWTREGVIRGAVAPGVSWLRVRVPGFAPDMVAIPATDFGAGADLGETRLRAGLTLRGRVVDPAGKPVGAAVVTTSADDRTSAAVRTASDGTFAVEHLGPSRIVVRAETATLSGSVELLGPDDPNGATLVVRTR